MDSHDRMLAAFVAGDLGMADTRRWDEHLLECERCWRAVREDGDARRAAERLRLPPPPGLADQVRFARLADLGAACRGRRRRRGVPGRGARARAIGRARTRAAGRGRCRPLRAGSLATGYAVAGLRAPGSAGGGRPPGVGDGGRASDHAADLAAGRRRGGGGDIQPPVPNAARRARSVRNWYGMVGTTRDGAAVLR